MFGAKGFDDVPISTAVRASGALPMVYAPVQVKGRELIDGGIVSTTNLDIAVEAGAKLVVVINPIVPFVNDFCRGRSARCAGAPAYGSRDMGFPQIGYQAFKLLAHQRLHELAERWEDRYPGVDIVLIEPEPTDELMFQTSMMNFASRVEIARHGFESVTKHLAGEYDRYQRDRRAPRARHLGRSGCARWSSTSMSEQRASSAWRKILEGTDRRAAAPVGAGRLIEPRLADRARRRGSYSALSTALSRRSEAAELRIAMRTCRGSPRAAPPATSTPARARRAASSPPSMRRVGRPHEVGLAVGHLEPALAQGRGQSRTRSRQIPATRRASSSEQLRRASRAPAWETSETPRSGSSSASSSSEPGPPSA